MPEGPEVKTITEGLNTLLTGNILTEFVITPKSRYHTKAPDGYNSFLQSMSGGTVVKVVSVQCKGKFIWWTFSNGWLLWQTLGMSGGWYHVKKPYVGIELSYQSSLGDIKTLYYNDQRHFGTLKFFEPQTAQQELRWKLQSLGPDMLSDTALDFVKFKLIMRKVTIGKKIISNAIVDQSIISGVGNYLRSEALYKAGINPHRLISSLSDTELEALFNAIRNTIRDSYKTGGASIRHYSDINNTPGTFEFSMAVYGKTKDPEGYTVLAEKIGKDTQTTYWVAEKQV